MELTRAQRITLGVLAGLFAAAVLLLVAALSTQGDGPELPDDVISVYPAPGDLTLAQDEIRVRMQFGFEIDLLVDGIRIPEEAMQAQPEAGIYAFRPSDAAPITEWTQGTHTVELRWRPATGAGLEQSYSWFFTTN